MIIQIQQKCSSTYQGCLNDPKRIVKYGVLFVCSIVMIYQVKWLRPLCSTFQLKFKVQLSECFSKLNYPPITTHSHFDLNETISYPALTICRDPPYKPEAMAVCSHIVLLRHPLIYYYEQLFLALQFILSYTFHKCLAIFELRRS